MKSRDRSEPQRGQASSCSISSFSPGVGFNPGSGGSGGPPCPGHLHIHCQHLFFPSNTHTPTPSNSSPCSSQEGPCC